MELFLRNDYHFEILYATLFSWDMNSRGAKMKYFDEFKEIERLGEDLDIAKLKPILMKTYEELNLMKTSGKLVSNSKLLHFLFPNLLMPMDRANTLTYFYGNTNELVNKYIEIIDLSFEIMKQPLKWNYFLDNERNTTVPKIIDNAIILMVGKSLKKIKLNLWKNFRILLSTHNFFPFRLNELSHLAKLYWPFNHRLRILLHLFRILLYHRLSALILF